MTYLTRVVHAAFPPGRRVIAISDIHAHRACLEALLQKISFSKEDVLVIPGDILEKGPDSLGTLRLVMQLQRTHTVYVLAGNVDMWQLEWLTSDTAETAAQLLERLPQARAWHGSCLFEEMLREAQLHPQTVQEAMQARRLLRARFAQELGFLAGLPTILETPHAIFVHGGLPTEDVDALSGTDAFPYLKCDNYLEKAPCFSRWLVVGHWPATLYRTQRPCLLPYVSERQRIISIDGGCGVKRDGQLNALIFEDGRCERFTFASADDLPVGVARDAQAEKADSFYLRYTDCRVRVLSREGDCVLLEHLSTGRRLFAPQSFLYDEERRCSDISDYRPNVAPGERVSLVLRTSRGWIIKKDGVTGWYAGGIDPL